MSDFVDVNVTMHDGIDGEGRNAFNAKFFHDVFAVSDNGRQADIEFVGNLLVDIALHNERHHLNLAIAKNLLLEDLG